VGTQILDLYAGSGALGIEALSRGAGRAVFVERDAGALVSLRYNLESLRLAERARIVPGEAARALAILVRDGERFDAVFLDPPYETDEGHRALSGLGTGELLRERGVVVLEHATRYDAPQPELWLRGPSRRYGSVSITFYTRGAGGEKPRAPRSEDAP
jgi:16S rRNA (guanine(966)-N(2))-methyltransferase RsmD